MYKQFIRPAMFQMDAEDAHNYMVRMLRIYRHLPLVRNWIKKQYYSESEGITINGLHFKNRVGLSAGFDKNAEIFDELADFGFGFVELGTVTRSPQPGNPGCRIFRLEKDESIISRTGFNNNGIKEFEANLQTLRKGDYRIGVNINKDASSENNAIVDDFLFLFKELYDQVDYFSINWGSISPKSTTDVLHAIHDYRKEQKDYRMILIKIPADISPEILGQIIDIADLFDIDGFIATGPTTNRSELTHYSEDKLNQIGAGNVSGKGMGNKSREVVRLIRQMQKKNYIVIGAGGIMTVDDARMMLDAGADLIQIYSAFIYSGPSIIRKIIKKIG